MEWLDSKSLFVSEKHFIQVSIREFNRTKIKKYQNDKNKIGSIVTLYIYIFIYLLDLSVVEYLSKGTLKDAL